jgi:acyl dehydratase
MSDIAKQKEAFEAKIRAYVGLKEGAPTVGGDLVNEPMIRHWCDALGDENAAYLDPNLAKDTVHGGIVAPPAMLQAWVLPGYPMHDSALVETNKQRELHRVFDEHGYTGVVATNTEQEYKRYLRPGDQVTAETTIESLSEQKATALGVGYFIVTRTIFGRAATRESC